MKVLGVSRGSWVAGMEAFCVKQWVGDGERVRAQIRSRWHGDAMKLHGCILATAPLFLVKGMKRPGAFSAIV